MCHRTHSNNWNDVIISQHCNALGRFSIQFSIYVTSQRSKVTIQKHTRPPQGQHGTAPLAPRVSEKRQSNKVCDMKLRVKSQRSTLRRKKKHKRAEKWKVLSLTCRFSFIHSSKEALQCNLLPESGTRSVTAQNTKVMPFSAAPASLLSAGWRLKILSLLYWSSFVNLSIK